MKLGASALGLAVGIVSGIGTFIVTLMVHQQGGGGKLQLLSVIFFGYSVSLGGAFIGLIWGLIYGFVAGALIAWLYNTLQPMMSKSGGAAA